MVDENMGLYLFVAMHDHPTLKVKKAAALLSYAQNVWSNFNLILLFVALSGN